jgi:hypothetical protein
MQNLNPLQKFQLHGSLSSMAAVAETIFCDPSDFSKPLRLEPHQRDVFNMFEFGYDILQFDEPPKYIDGKWYRPRFYVLPWQRKMGKTMTCALMSLAACIVLPPPIYVGMYGPNDEAAQRLLEMTRMFVERSPSNLMRYINKKSLSTYKIEFINGTKLEAFNSSEKDIRGPKIDYAFIDEIDQFENPKTIEGAIIPTTRDSLRFGRGLIFSLSTPNRDNKGSVFRKYVKRASDDMVLYCGGCKKSFSIDQWLGSNPLLRDTMNRRDFSPLFPIPNIGPCHCGANKWHYVFKYYAVIATDAYCSPRFSREQIDMEMEMAIDKNLAKQELLAVFLETSGGIFSPQMLDACIDKNLMNHGAADRRNRMDGKTRFMGMDIGRQKDHTVFVSLDQKRGSDELSLFNIETLPVGHLIDWDRIYDSTMAYIDKFHPDMAIVDSTGVGDPFIERLVKGLATKRGYICRIFSNKLHRNGFVMDKTSKPDMVLNLELMVKSRLIKLPPTSERGIQELFDEMIDFNYDFTESNSIVFGGDTGHDDRVIALGLAAWGAKQRRYPTGMHASTVGRID